MCLSKDAKTKKCKADGIQDVSHDSFQNSLPTIKTDVENVRSEHHSLSMNIQIESVQWKATNKQKKRQLQYILALKKVSS